MTPEEREAVRQELREGSEAMWRFVQEHGDTRQELLELYGDPWVPVGKIDAA